MLHDQNVIQINIRRKVSRGIRQPKVAQELSKPIIFKVNYKSI